MVGNRSDTTAPYVTGITNLKSEQLKPGEVEFSDQVKLVESAIEVDCLTLCGEKKEFAVHTFVKAIFLAHAYEKDEVIAYNIAPWINNYCDRTCTSTEAQNWFETVITDASKILEWSVPPVMQGKRDDNLAFRLHISRDISD